MFHLELRASRKYLTQLGEGAGDEGLLAAVMPCERVGAHHGPVDVVSYVFEEGSAVALLESLEDFANTLGCDSHWISPWFAVCQLMRRTAARDRFTGSAENSAGLARDRLVHHVALHDANSLGIFGQDRAGLGHLRGARR